MNPLAQAVQDLIALGMEGDALVAALNRMEQAIYVDRAGAADPVANKRRAYDRERKREARANREQMSGGIPVDSEDSTDIADSLSLPPSPRTPQPPTHTHGDITTRTRKADGEPDGFAAFWAVYPRRIGKDAARKAFVTAAKRTSLAELLAAVQRDTAGQWAGRPPDMIPHPATWLNQGRWQDEPPPPTPLRQPHERSHANPKFDSHQANLERALAGAEVASRLRAVESSGGF